MNPYLRLFKTFLFCGFLSAGNGYAAIEPLRRRITAMPGGMSNEEFDNTLAVVNAMPGVFSINLGSCFGHRLHGWKGTAAALTGILLPPMVLRAIVRSFWNELHRQPGFAAFLKGTRPAVIALLVMPLVRTARNARISLSTVWLPVGTVLAICLLGVSPAYIVSGVILLGILYGMFVHPTE